MHEKIILYFLRTFISYFIFWQTTVLDLIKRISVLRHSAEAEKVKYFHKLYEKTDVYGILISLKEFYLYITDDKTDISKEINFESEFLLLLQYAKWKGIQEDATMYLEWVLDAFRESGYDKLELKEEVIVTYKKEIVNMGKRPNKSIRFLIDLDKRKK